LGGNAEAAAFVPKGMKAAFLLGDEPEAMMQACLRIMTSGGRQEAWHEV